MDLLTLKYLIEIKGDRLVEILYFYCTNHALQQINGFLTELNSLIIQGSTNTVYYHFYHSYNTLQYWLEIWPKSMWVSLEVTPVINAL